MRSTESQYLTKDVTYGVSSTGNVPALQMSLATILMGSVLPARILIRMEGEFPAFSSFYMEQLAELARIKGVEFSITTDKSHGIRYARDWLIQECRTKYLWMGDDDVLYAPHCLQNMALAVQELVGRKVAVDTIGYINGNKPDVNNRRGYQDFSTEPRRSEEVQPNSGYNAFFCGNNTVVECLTADTGNLLIDVENVKREGVKFKVFDKAWNSSGDDTLFALMCAKKKLSGWFTTRADSFHLEKPNVRFNEFTARKNMLLRECALLDLNPKVLDSMLPWLK